MVSTAMLTCVPPTPGAPVRRGFRPDIQGLRAVAVFLVLLGHAGAPFLGGGFVGVDVFFVISGFLISVHLVESLERTGRIPFARFYASRARRILPAALVTVALTASASALTLSPLRLAEIFQDGIGAVLYVPNLVFAARKTDYLAGTAPSPFQHFWSLGVEEQFYLVWPALLLVAFPLVRRSRRRLALVMATVAVVSFGASVLTTPVAPSLAFFSPHTRAWEFAVGAVLAAAGHVFARVPDRLARLLVWCGLAVVLGSAVAFSATTEYPGFAAAVPVLGAALLVAFGGRGGGIRLLALRPVQFIGAISYSLYLVHWPILVLVHERMGLDEPMPPLLAGALIALSVPAAWLLYRFVETPFRRTARTGHRPVSPRRTLGVTAIASVTLVGLLCVGIIWSSSLSLTSGRTEAASAPTLSPEGTAFVPQNVRPSLEAATEDTGALYTDGCQQKVSGARVIACTFGDAESTRTIALFGDSHAGRWFPAVNEASKALAYRLVTYTKSGCRSEETVAAWDSASAHACTVWRDAVLKTLRSDPPDVIVLANHLGPHPGETRNAEEGDWLDGLTRLYGLLPSSSRVVTLADSPEFASSPVICLSTHPTDARDCSVAKSSALNESIRAAQVTAAQQNGAVVVDLTGYFCNAESCPAVIGSTLVYSDEHHMTATFSRSLGPVMADALAAAIPVGSVPTASR